MRTSCFLYSLLRGLRITVAYLLLHNLVVIDVKAQLPALSNAFIRAGKGILLGIPTNKEPGVLGYTASNDSYVVWSPASNTFVPLAVGTVSGGTLTNIVLQGASGTSNYLAYSNNPLVPAMGYLTYTVTNGAGNTLTSILVQVTSGSSNVITFTNNPLKPALGYLTYTMTNSIGSFLPTTGGGVTGSVVITGGLTVYGTQTIYNAVTINSYTQYNLGVSTNFIYTTIYSTNVIYQTTELNIQTNITYSTIDAYNGWNFIGAYLNATGAPYVWAPHFRDTLTNSLDANGIWNFSNATVVGLQGVGTSNTWVQAGTNITISASNGNGGVYFTLSSSATAVTQTGHVHQAGSDLTVSTTNGNGNAYITYGLDMTGLSNRWLLGVTSSISGFTFTNNPLNPFAVLVETGDLVLANGATISGDLNANGNIEIANTKHLRFLDGGGTNRVHLEATAGRLIVTGALDLVSGQAVPFTVNGGTFLSTNGILTGGGNNMLVISNGNGLVYLSVSSNQTAAVTNAVQMIELPDSTSTPTRVQLVAGLGHSITSTVSGATTTVYIANSGVGDVFSTSNNTFSGGTTQSVAQLRASNIVVSGRNGPQLQVLEPVSGRGFTVRVTNSAATYPISYQFDTPNSSVYNNIIITEGGTKVLAITGANQQPGFGPDYLDNASAYSRLSSSPAYAMPTVNMRWYTPGSSAGQFNFMIFSNSYIHGRRAFVVSSSTTPTAITTNYAGEAFNTFSPGNVLVNVSGGTATPASIPFGVLTPSNNLYAFYARPWDASTQRARAPRLVVTTNQFNTTYTNNFGFAARVLVNLVLTNTLTDSAKISLQVTGGRVWSTVTCPSSGVVETNETFIQGIVNSEDTWCITNRSTGSAGAGILSTIIVND